MARLSLAFVLFSSVFLVYNAAAKPSSGCASGQFNPTTDHYTSVVKGKGQYRLVFPRRYRPRRPTPIVIALTDRGQTPEELILKSMMSNPEINEQAITLYPAPPMVGKLSSISHIYTPIDM
jgi:hypothetical protein